MRQIFIVGRFRTGTSLIWNLFRQTKRYATFYEPLHESIATEIRNNNSPKILKHFGMKHKFTEYRDYNIQLQDDPQLALQNLYIKRPSEPFDALYVRLSKLVHKADKDIVIKSNRLDFRINWLERYYQANTRANITIIYIKRNPRNSYISTIETSSPKPSPKWATNPFCINPQRSHIYYLKQYIQILGRKFPFLLRTKSNNYEKYYFIYKKSLEMAEQYADVIIDYDKLIRTPRTELKKLEDYIDIEQSIPLVRTNDKKTPVTYLDIDFKHTETFVDYAYNIDLTHTHTYQNFMEHYWQDYYRCFHTL